MERQPATGFVLAEKHDKTPIDKMWKKSSAGEGQVAVVGNDQASMQLLAGKSREPKRTHVLTGRSNHWRPFGLRTEPMVAATILLMIGPDHAV